MLWWKSPSAFSFFLIHVEKTGGWLVVTGKVWGFFVFFVFKSLEEQVCFSPEVLASSFVRASGEFFIWYQIPCFRHNLPFFLPPLLGSGYCTLSYSAQSWQLNGEGPWVFFRFFSFIALYHSDWKVFYHCNICVSKLSKMYFWGSMVLCLRC